MRRSAIIGGLTMAKKTRILIADDHAMVRQGIASFLSMSQEFEVVGEAATAWRPSRP